MADDRELETLRKENAELREKLARATLEAKLYRDSTNALLAEVDPYVPMTEDEIRELCDPNDQVPFADILAEFTRVHPD